MFSRVSELQLAVQCGTWKEEPLTIIPLKPPKGYGLRRTNWTNCSSRTRLFGTNCQLVVVVGSVQRPYRSLNKPKMVEQ